MPGSSSSESPERFDRYGRVIPKKSKVIPNSSDRSRSHSRSHSQSSKVIDLTQSPRRRNSMRRSRSPGRRSPGRRSPGRRSRSPKSYSRGEKRSRSPLELILPVPRSQRDYDRHRDRERPNQPRRYRRNSRDRLVSMSPSPPRDKQERAINVTNQQDPELQKARVFIGNLPYDKVTKGELEDMFDKYGKLLGKFLIYIINIFFLVA